jgi:ubiquitin related modifier 1
MLTTLTSGGLEILFDNISKHILSFTKDDNWTVGRLINHLTTNLMKDPRQELFVVDGNVRPGILVLINDSDWELEGEDGYELKDKDCILFVSTLHGG